MDQKIGVFEEEQIPDVFRTSHLIHRFAGISGMLNSVSAIIIKPSVNIVTDFPDIQEFGYDLKSPDDYIGFAGIIRDQDVDEKVPLKTTLRAVYRAYSSLESAHVKRILPAVHLETSGVPRMPREFTCGSTQYGRGKGLEDFLTRALCATDTTILLSQSIPNTVTRVISVYTDKKTQLTSIPEISRWLRSGETVGKVKELMGV